jgi:hypothetical protein
VPVSQKNIFTNVSNNGPYINNNPVTEKSFDLLIFHVDLLKAIMALTVEELEDQEKYREILSLSYDDLVQFIFDQLKSKKAMMVFFWSACILSLGLAIIIRLNIGGYYAWNSIILHTLLGLIVLPALCIPIHEFLHIVPYFLSGARNIRVGMDMKQFLFYVTAHRYVAGPVQFKIVAVIPFIVFTVTSVFLILILPGLWKWTIAVFLFFHTTACAGDFALLNFYFRNRAKKIFTWDDADRKMAYFYERI